jgi:hypothetical protein
MERAAACRVEARADNRELVQRADEALTEGLLADEAEQRHHGQQQREDRGEPYQASATTSKLALSSLNFFITAYGTPAHRTRRCQPSTAVITRRGIPAGFTGSSERERRSRMRRSDGALSWLASFRNLCPRCPLMNVVRRSSKVI